MLRGMRLQAISPLFAKAAPAWDFVVAGAGHF
jgi:hypothetical protein